MEFITNSDAGTPEGQPARSAAATHSSDFRSVLWFGVRYSFTPNQAKIIRVLWLAWEERTLDIGREMLIQAAGCKTKRMNIIFRGHRAWKTLIVQGELRGTYRLAE